MKISRQTITVNLEIGQLDWIRDYIATVPGNVPRSVSAFIRSAVEDKIAIINNALQFLPGKEKS